MAAELDIQQLREKRRSVLLVAWGEAKRLTAEELAEIADLLPKAPPAFELQPQIEGQSDRKYQRLQEEYAAIYGQSLRTIKRWVKENAPLDEPKKMATWWAATKKQRVPAKLLELAKLEDVAPGSVEVRGAALATAAGLSLLEQCRSIVEVAYQELQSAIKAADAARITLAQRSYNDAAEQLRKMELADPNIRKAAGTVVEKEKVQTALVRIHTEIAQSIRSFLKQMRRATSGKTAAEQDQIWIEGEEKLFGSFNSGVFLDAL